MWKQNGEWGGGVITQTDTMIQPRTPVRRQPRDDIAFCRQARLSITHRTIILIVWALYLREVSGVSTHTGGRSCSCHRWLMNACYKPKRRGHVLTPSLGRAASADSSTVIWFCRCSSFRREECLSADPLFHEGAEGSGGPGWGWGRLTALRRSGQIITKIHPTTPSPFRQTAIERQTDRYGRTGRYRWIEKTDRGTDRYTDIQTPAWQKTDRQTDR